MHLERHRRHSGDRACHIEREWASEKEELVRLEGETGPVWIV